MKLYDYLDSGNGYKVRLTLAHLGLACEWTECDILHGATRTPEFLARNPSLGTTIIQDAEIETETYLQKEVDELRKDGTRVTSMMCEGPVPDTILAAADEVHADLIAMSTHGRSGIQRMLLGSVADKVVHLSHIPVMLVHPN